MMWIPNGENRILKVTELNDFTNNDISLPKEMSDFFMGTGENQRLIFVYQGKEYPGYLETEGGMTHLKWSKVIVKKLREAFPSYEEWFESNQNPTEEETPKIEFAKERDQYHIRFIFGEIQENQKRTKTLVVDHKKSQLKTLLEEWIKGYSNYYPRDFRFSFKDIIKVEIPDALMNLLGEKEKDYRIIGFPGETQWAEIPWVGVMHKATTQSIYEGVSLVYLLGMDSKILYLGLIYGNPTMGIRSLSEEAKRLRESLDVGLFKTNHQEIYLGNQSFVSGTICYQAYTEELPDEEVLQGDFLKLLEIYESYVEETKPEKIGDNGLKNEKEILEIVEEQVVVEKVIEEKMIKEQEIKKEEIKVESNGWQREEKSLGEASKKTKAEEPTVTAEDAYPLPKNLENRKITPVLEDILSKMSQKGYHYPMEIVKNYYLSLKTKPFVIITGGIGTGKTTFPEIFGEVIGAKSENGRFFKIRAKESWTDSSVLLGSLDLRGHFIPGIVPQLLKSAKENLEKPCFLLIDDMNNGEVEKYFYELLQGINGFQEPIIPRENFGSDISAFREYGDLEFTENIYVIGTINVTAKEKKLPLKVADSGNTLEMPTPQIGFFPDYVALAYNKEWDNDQFKIRKKTPELPKALEKIMKEMRKVQKILEEYSQPMSYRGINEILGFGINSASENLYDVPEIINLCIRQRVMPTLDREQIDYLDLVQELEGFLENLKE
ncbi:MAG: MrcB family domain-containing protein [Eubacteriaceae bacterium]